MDTKGVTMFPPTEAHSNLAEIHARDSKSGELRVREHFYAHQLKQDTPEKQDKFFQAGGAGLFAKPKEYVKLLATILNEGTSPTTGKQILKPESVELFWENQIPNQYVDTFLLPSPLKTNHSCLPNHLNPTQPRTPPPARTTNTHSSDPTSRATAHPLRTRRSSTRPPSSTRSRATRRKAGRTRGS